MANIYKKTFLATLESRFKNIKKLPNSQSLYDIADGQVRLYIRYSKIHGRNQAFYGLRNIDLHQLQGKPSLICFLWDQDTDPLLLPYSEYEDIFNEIEPASDGQYKVQLYGKKQGFEFYIPNIGYFNVESYLGFDVIDRIINREYLRIPELSHSQIQGLLGVIGSKKGYNVWFPASDRLKIEETIIKSISCTTYFPPSLNPIRSVAEEIDVIWLDRGAGTVKAFFEVEHTTPIYSGLLRFNDVHIIEPNINTVFGIVSNSEKKSLFTKQVNRPTFKASRLNEICTFLEYHNVFEWHERMIKNG